MKNSDAFVGAALGAFAAACLLAGILFYRALVMTVLWGWFVVPLGMPELSVPAGLGLMLLVTLMTSVNIKDAKVDGLKVLLQPLFMLCIGFLVQPFI